MITVLNNSQNYALDKLVVRVKLTKKNKNETKELAVWKHQILDKNCQFSETIKFNVEIDGDHTLRIDVEYESK